MEEILTTHATISGMAMTTKMPHDKQSALDRFEAAADAFKRALDERMAAADCSDDVDDSQKELTRAVGIEHEMERCGRELEESVRIVVAAFAPVGSSNQANSDSTGSVDGENYSVDAEEESAYGDDTSSLWRDSESSTGCDHAHEDSPRGVLISTLKRENTCLLAKIRILEKEVENTEVRRALDAELWAKRIKTVEVNASLTVANQRALEVECGAERRRVEHLRETITELNSRLTAAEQATCRARMATVMMEAKYLFDTKMPTVDESKPSSDDQMPAVRVEQTNQPSEDHGAPPPDEYSTQHDQDARSQSSTSSEGNQPRGRSGSLLRSPTGYKPRQCSRSRCLAYPSDEAQQAAADDFTSPRTRRSSLHFSPSKTTTPEDRGTRSIRPRSEPPIDLRSAQRPRWKR